MTNTTVTHAGHSAVIFERGSSKLIIDPGIYCSPAALVGATAILVTHDHTDHLDAPAVAATLAANSEAEVWAPQSVIDSLLAVGVAAEQTHPVAGSEHFMAAGFDVAVYGKTHAAIYGAPPPAENVAYVIDGVALHPGDSFTTPPSTEGIKLVFVPINGPWMKPAEAIDFVAGIRPEVATPIHDGFLNDAGLIISDNVIARALVALGAGEYRRREGEPVFSYEV